MKTLKQVLAVASVALLLAGCATNHSNSGGMGNGSETGTTEAPMGPNGSVGPGNPLGVGPGSGLTPGN